MQATEGIDSDVLHNFVCASCDRHFYEYGKFAVCPSCGGNKTILLDQVNTCSATAGDTAIVWDNLHTIEEDMEQETQRLELEKELVKTEKLRRGVDVKL